MSVAITVLYLLTFVIIALWAVQKIIENKSISLYPMFLLAIDVLYLLIPAILFMFGAYDRQASDLVAVIYTSSNRRRISTYFIVLLCVVIVSLLQELRIKKWSRKTPLLCAPQDPSQVRDITYRVCQKWFWVMWGVGMLFTLVMMLKIGPHGFILYSGSARGEGSLPIESGSLFAYAVNFSRVLIASLVPGILMHEIKPSVKMKCILGVTLVFSLLLLIFNAGKTNFIIFLVPIAVYCISKWCKFKVRYLVLAGVFAGILAIFLVPLLDNLFYLISTGESVGKYRDSWNVINYLVSIARQFAYPYSNMILREQMTALYGYRFFVDYAAVIINLFPAALFGGFEIKTLYHVTTEYYQTMLSHRGGMPNDYLFFSYRQLGVAGVAIIGALTGAAIRALDRLLFLVKDAFSLIRINGAHFFVSFSLASVVFILIEPLSVLTSFPMVVAAVLMMIHLSLRLGRASRVSPCESPEAE